jgi:hypothetical protein
MASIRHAKSLGINFLSTDELPREPGLPGTSTIPGPIEVDLLPTGPAISAPVKDFNFFGAGFSNPWDGNPTGEVGALNAKPKYWSPASDAFGEVAADGSTPGDVVGTKKFESILDFLDLETGPPLNARIGTLRILSHGDSTMIAFDGTMHTDGTVLMSTPTCLDVKSLKLYDPKIAKLRARFSKNGRIVCYACHTGSDPAFLKAIATAFQVKVAGFKDEVLFCPDYVTSVTDRSYTVYVSPPGTNPCSAKKRGFVHLVPDLTANP